MDPSTSRVLLPQPVFAGEPPLGESGLPLIWCPYCGMGRILELLSNQTSTQWKGSSNARGSTRRFGFLIEIADGN